MGCSNGGKTLLGDNHNLTGLLTARPDYTLAAPGEQGGKGAINSDDSRARHKSRFLTRQTPAF